MKKTELEYYMKLVLREAQKALKEGEMPIAALIVKDGEILSIAHNKVEKTQCATDHAEILAIKKASKKLNNFRLDGATMFVNVEPCAMCMGAIGLSRIDTLVFGCREKKFGACKSLYDLSLFFPKKIRIIEGVLEDEARNLMQLAFKR